MEMIRYQMKYKINKGKLDNVILNILGKVFVKNNRNKAKLIYRNKKYNLKDYFKLYNFKKSELKIDILLSQDICNISYMFNKCESILKFSMKNNKKNYEIDNYFPELEKNKNELEYNRNEIDENKGTLFEGLEDNLFYCECSEISKKEVSSEIENLYLIMDNLETNNKSEEMIYEIESSSSLSYKLNFNNIINISYMFNNCVSLSSLPDISKWNTNNVKESLPDISKWNTNNIIDMSFMFSNCKSLSSLPDISKWNTKNVKDMSGMFSNCKSLLSLPDISKWNTNNANIMVGMFHNC